MFGPADRCNRLRCQDLQLFSADGMASAFTSVDMDNLITIKRASELTVVIAGAAYGSIAVINNAPTMRACVMARVFSNWRTLVHSGLVVGHRCGGVES